MAVLKTTLYVCFLVLLNLSTLVVYGQDSTFVKNEGTIDTVKLKKTHSPFKATIMSVALPGLGQIYNGKWWKVPIIYGALGGLVYSSVWNHQQCKTYRDAYLIRVDDDPTTIDQFEGKYSDANLRELKDSYQRNRDLSLVFTGIIYLLNIVDASVDGHLKDFDVSDDLTLKVQPTIHQIGPEAIPMPAIGFALLFK